MNVYDFDKTIYNGDSSIQFYLYNLVRSPQIIKYWPVQISSFIQYKLDKIDKTRMKTSFYRYFKSIKNIDERVDRFWIRNERRVFSWYLAQKQASDLIISASPEFLLKPICAKLEVNLIASVVDVDTGVNMRPNCFGEEKVVRFLEQYPDGQIDQFYSDSYSDDPLARLARQSYLVKKDQRNAWQDPREAAAD